ncbi:MAG: putative acetyltransferase [Francisella sp.]|jgi:putative acetyltransferase
MDINIRYENLENQEFIYNLISECFDDDEEKLVRLLHRNNQSLISLVTEINEQIVGQIIFSEMFNDSDSIID